MKILISTAAYPPMINGVAVFSRNLAVGLAKRGHDVMVVCPSQNGKAHVRTVDGVKITYLKSMTVKIYPDQIHNVPPKNKIGRLELPRLFYKHGISISPFPRKEIQRVIDAFRPDVVHVQVADPIGVVVVAYARKCSIPVVTTEHNQPEVFTGSMHLPKPIAKAVNAVLNTYFVNRQSKSDFVTMPTEKAIDNLILSRRKPFSVPVAAISNGVDLSEFHPGRADATIYEKYHLDKNRKTFLSLGRLDPEKNVSAVIEAYLMAAEKMSDTQLIIVGDGVDRARLIKKAARHPDIHFLGRVLPPELYLVYRLGDVFVTASEIETQGIVLIEAAATGMPLIAVDKGAVSEVCQNGKNGILCRPGDVSEMADAMVKIMSDDKLRAEYSRQSVKIASEHDLEKTLDKFINIYKRVTRTS